MVTGHQLAAARSLAGLALDDLAERAGIDPGMLAALERAGALPLHDGAPGLTAARRSLEAAGVRLLEEPVRGVLLKPSGPVDEGLRPESLSAENDD